MKNMFTVVRALHILPLPYRSFVPRYDISLQRGEHECMKLFLTNLPYVENEIVFTTTTCVYF